MDVPLNTLLTLYFGSNFFGKRFELRKLFWSFFILFFDRTKIEKNLVKQMWYENKNENDT